MAISEIDITNRKMIVYTEDLKKILANLNMGYKATVELVHYGYTPSLDVYEVQVESIEEVARFLIVQLSPLYVFEKEEVAA